MTPVVEPGAPLRLDAGGVRVVLRWSWQHSGAGAPDLDLSALLLGPDGRVGQEGDFVFYNQPAHPSGLVRRLPKQRAADGVRDVVHAELTELAPGIERLALAASADGGFRAELSRPELTVHDAASGEPLAGLPLRPGPRETAVLCGELARAGDGGWELRAIGRGFTGGLVALAAEFGIGAARRPPPTPHGYAGADPTFTLPPQGPQFLPNAGSGAGT
ncbi:TerD family protein [Streptomyces triticirhizae]|uniref:TerD family protein n=1 Tax=Streptomyces triticirhizae TaxID=2483353 RepID=A0A3M2M9C5_9ACTN|nr:TerD family protein [Streptomyces triticirhizae]RMI45195.1 TerD family protein [Streptomyces triticirhizae]